MKKNNSKYKIVIVDDEKEICESIKSILQASGYCVEIFLNAHSTYNYITKCNDNLPDIVITDYKLIGQSGLELLERIKNTYPEISVIIMTGYGDKKLIVESLRFGAEDFIDKPLNPKDLRSAIEKIINKREAHLQIQTQKTNAVQHEINNHLTIIKGNAQLLKYENENNLEISEILDNQIDLLKSSIQTMLAPENFIKSSIKLKKENINLKPLIETAIFLLENNALDKNINIEADLIDSNIEADVNYLRQVVMNILLNAIIYSAENSKIRISIINESEFIIIEIADEGIGIPDDFKKNIFNYGFRVNKDIKGCGIGLFFALNVIKAHNGRIEVADNKPQGSIFRIIMNCEL